VFLSILARLLAFLPDAACSALPFRERLCALGWPQKKVLGLLATWGAAFSFLRPSLSMLPRRKQLRYKTS